LKPDEILTLAEVALLLTVAIYTMAQRGKVPAFKVRGRGRSRHGDLDDCIEEQKLSQRDHDKPVEGRG
jgi:hypothetical protein